MDQAVDERIRAANAESRRVFDFERTSSYISPHALNLVRDAVVALDPHGYITYLNSAAEQLYGWTSNEAIGRVAKTTLFADCHSAFEKAWLTTLKRSEWRGHFVQRKGNGAECVVDSYFAAVRDSPTQTITSILVVSFENSELNTTAATLAHEIRNPLASIKGVAEAFLQRRQLSQQERQWLEAVRHEVSKIDARVRELLNLSQPRVSHAKQCSLNELIGNVVLLAMHHVASIKACEGRKISIQFINATTKPLTMILDSARIEDAILNLVLNAIESIEGDGEVTVCLRRSHRRHNSANAVGEALIEVSDTGCGVPHELRRQIFQPKFTTKRNGAGLGLAAVRRTAAAYHGRISFRTELGRGSKFVLALPLPR